MGIVEYLNETLSHHDLFVSVRLKHLDIAPFKLLIINKKHVLYIPSLTTHNF